ncbi:MAG: TonB-dependent receptor [Chitinophagaceae bacterium]
MRKLVCLLILCSTFHARLLAQQMVTGKVSVADSVLEGVTVLVKGGNQAAITNAKGVFQISVPANAVLLFSHVGYSLQEVAVGSRTNIQVQLQSTNQGLQDVVVVGYGTQKKANLTGSIATISASAYKDQPVVSVSSALQGRASGVAVSTASGAPGGVVKIRIRGINSINSSNDPLFVVDGVALGSTSFQDINVNDIESMDVLKDASATAIYGSRGANGVIIITTKSGKAGKMVVEFNTFLSSNKIKKYDLLGPAAYAEQANHISGTTVISNPGSGTDWQDQVFRKGITQNYQLSVSGGTDKSRYYLSGYYVNQSGIITNTSQQKIALRSNIDSKLTDRLSVGVNLFLTNIQSLNNGDLGSKANPVVSSLAWAPTEPVYDSAGHYNRYAVSPIGPNPYMIAKESNYPGKSNTVVVNAKVKYDINDWLSFSTNFGVDANFYRSFYLNNEWINQTNISSGQGYSDNYTLQNSNVLTYHNIFNKIHNLTVTGVYEQTSNKYSGFAADGGGLSSTTYGYYALQLNATQGISSYYSNWGLQSFLGRISYSLKDKYLLTATYRADGSSKFQSTKNKWGYFPSVSAGWRLSEEDFIKDMNTFSNLKLRASWGITGNQAIAPYSTLGLLNGQQYSYGTGTSYQGYTLGNPSNLNLKWETTKQWDIGADAGLLAGRVNISMDYFSKKTDGLLLQKTIPDYDGGGSQWVNLGAVTNKGFEFSINATPVRTNNFSWSTTLNFTSYKSRVDNLGGQDIIYAGSPGSGLINTSIQVVKPGYALGSFYLIPWEGVYNADDATLGFKAGDNKYRDVDGNKSIGYEDRVISGNSNPTFQFGFNNDISWKDFSLNVFIQGSQGNKIFNGTYAAIAAPSSDIRYPTLAASANYWSSKNPGSEWADPASKTGRSYIESTHYLQNGSYVRLKNISLSYTIGKKLAGFGNIRLSLSAQNIITATKYKGFDPEADTMGNSDISSGIDLGAYPNPRTITIGLNAKF